MEAVFGYIGEFGLMLVIAGLFVWDWVSNKKQNTDALNNISRAMNTIGQCMAEIQNSNLNISKALSILQTSVDNTSSKLDILLDRLHN